MTSTDVPAVYVPTAESSRHQVPATDELASVAVSVNVWSPEYVGDTQTLRVHVSHLRRKIEPADVPRHILTEPGVGFRFADEA